MAKCETECRDELFTVINKKADKSGVWKAVIITLGVGTLFWGVIAWSFAESGKLKDLSAAEIKQRCQENSRQISGTAIKIAEIVIKVKQLQESNEELSIDVKTLIREIRKQNGRTAHN